MQLKLPIFPADTKLFNACFGVYTKGDHVYYLHSGSPVGMHDKNDLRSFRCKIAQFISVNLCTRSEVVRTLNVTASYVKRCSKLYESKGEAGFWEKDNRHGHCYRVTPDMLIRIQQKIDRSQSVLSIAKEEGIGESHIRYYIGKGDLKKKILAQ